MIEINLLPGKKKKKKAGAGFQLPDFQELVANVKDPLLIGAVVAWVGAILVIGFVFITETARGASLSEQESRLEAQELQFRNVINQRRRLVRLRDSLVAELNEIRDIDGDRYVWPHILDEVSRALPDYTWLVGLDVVQAPPVFAAGQPADTAQVPRDVRFRVDGRTSDIGAYTRFLRQLAASPWIGDIDPGATQTVLEDDKPLTAFSIMATFRQADSAFMQTVPLDASVVR